MNHVSKPIFHIIPKCTKTESIGYWSQLHKLSPQCFPFLVYQFLQAGWQEYPHPLFLPKSKWSTADAFQGIWKPHSNIRIISPIGENTEEPQMVQEQATGPSFNILVLPHWVLFPTNNAAKYLETLAPRRRVLLGGPYSGDQDPIFSFIWWILNQCTA